MYTIFDEDMSYDHLLQLNWIKPNKLLERYTKKLKKFERFLPGRHCLMIYLLKRNIESTKVATRAYGVRFVNGNTTSDVFRIDFSLQNLPPLSQTVDKAITDRVLEFSSRCKYLDCPDGSVLSELARFISKIAFDFKREDWRCLRPFVESRLKINAMSAEEEAITEDRDWVQLYPLVRSVKQFVQLNEWADLAKDLLNKPYKTFELLMPGKMTGACAPEYFVLPRSFDEHLHYGDYTTKILRLSPDCTFQTPQTFENCVADVEKMTSLFAIAGIHSFIELPQKDIVWKSVGQLSNFLNLVCDLQQVPEYRQEMTEYGKEMRLHWRPNRWCALSQSQIEQQVPGTETDMFEKMFGKLRDGWNPMKPQDYVLDLYRRPSADLFGKWGCRSHGNQFLAAYCLDLLPAQVLYPSKYTQNVFDACYSHQQMMRSFKLEFCVMCGTQEKEANLRVCRAKGDNPLATEQDRIRCALQMHFVCTDCATDTCLCPFHSDVQAADEPDFDQMVKETAWLSAQKWYNNCKRKDKPFPGYVTEKPKEQKKAETAKQQDPTKEPPAAQKPNSEKKPDDQTQDKPRQMTLKEFSNPGQTTRKSTRLQKRQGETQTSTKSKKVKKTKTKPAKVLYFYKLEDENERAEYQYEFAKMRSDCVSQFFVGDEDLHKDTTQARVDYYKFIEETGVATQCEVLDKKMYFLRYNKPNQDKKKMKFGFVKVRFKPAELHPIIFFVPTYFFQIKNFDHDNTNRLLNEEDVQSDGLFAFYFQTFETTFEETLGKLQDIDLKIVATKLPSISAFVEKFASTDEFQTVIDHCNHFWPSECKLNTDYELYFYKSGAEIQDHVEIDEGGDDLLFFRMMYSYLEAKRRNIWPKSA